MVSGVSRQCWSPGCRPWEREWELVSGKTFAAGGALLVFGLVNGVAGGRALGAQLGSASGSAVRESTL
jgi:hypothetical protein